MNLKRDFILILILFRFALLAGSNETIRIEDYSYEDGLTTSTVYKIYKDSRGFIWLCSLNGLYRYDGYNFRKLSTLVNSNKNYTTYCISEDIDKNLWIGTSAKGLMHYDTHKEKLSEVKLTIPCNTLIHKILFFKDKIWLATNYGLYVITPGKNFDENQVLQTRVILPDSIHVNSQINKINDLFSVKENDAIWVGTNGAMFELNSSTLILKQIFTHPQNAITSIAAYDSNLIVGSWDGGIFKLNTGKKKLENDAFVTEVNKVLSNKCITSLFYDNKKRLWVATCSNGLYVFENLGNGRIKYENYSTEEKNNLRLKSGFINFMYVDNEGIVWLSMNQPALTKVYFQGSNLQYIKLSETKQPGTTTIVSAYKSIYPNRVWVSTVGQGIFLYDFQNQTFKNYTTKTSSELRLINDNVSYCYQDKKGNLWIIYNRLGLYVVPAAEAMKLMLGKAVNPIDANSLLSNDSRKNSYTTCIFEDNNGRIWIALWGSLFIVKTDAEFFTAKDIDQLKSGSKISTVYCTDNPTNNGVPIAPVLTILEKQPDVFWLGTLFSGISQIIEVSPGVFEYNPLDLNNKLPGNNIKSLVKDIHNNIWIGTNAGICRLENKSNTLNIFTEKDGLASENINNVTLDSNENIWVSTSYGISEISSKDFLVKNYLFTDKDIPNQYILNAASFLPEGKLFFSLPDGLVLINPDKVFSTSKNPPLYFTDIKIDNKTVHPFEKINGTRIMDANINECSLIKVPYNHTLSLDFAALDFLNPAENLYKYRIGSNKEWIILNSNQRSISLMNMKPGEYTLSVMLVNSKGNLIRTLNIKYLPPFWQSTLAFIIYFIVVFILFLTYRRLTIQKIVQKSVIEKERYERKKLEELDKMKSEFFTNISHEFRTPLSLIINPLEKLITDENISDQNRSKVKLILKSSNRLLKLTNELMDFSKIEKQLVKPHFQIADIISLANEVCHLFENIADSNNIDFRFSSLMGLFEFPFDKSMIEKVIFNLLSNAFKYTPNGGVVLCNITKIHFDEHDYVKISVINTGEGIAQHDLDKIFDRYYQVNNVQNMNVEGTGIGLSLVKNFIDMHKGKVEVSSEPNNETCFDVYLPVNQNILIVDERKQQNVKTDPVSNLENYNKPASHYQILIVEDDEDIRNYVSEELSVGFKVARAKDGNEGITMANELVPDLIITDVIMPGISGIELCRHLKNQVTTSHIPIIILSAKVTTEQQIEGLEMGADVYMIKPFNIEHIKAQILRLIHFKETVYSRFLKETALIPQGAFSTKLDEEFLQKIMTFIENNLSDTELSVDHLANCVSLSKVQVYRKLKAISGQSVVEFIRTVRLKKAAQMVLDKRLTFSEIAFETGFSTPSYFTKCFHDHFGKTPSEFAADYRDK